MNIRLFVIILSVLAIAACEKNTEEYIGIERTISLSADVASVDTSRSAFKGTSTKDMEASVWFSNVCGTYTNNTNPQAPNYLPYRATVKYLDGPTTVYVDPQNRNYPLSYPVERNSSAYCVGLYPANGWESSNGTVASHTIDGTSDIMLAEQLEGSWENPFTTQTYRHLLTWFKIEARVADVEAASQWGNITQICVTNPHNTVKITFDKEKDSSGNYESTIEYTGGTNELYALNDSMGTPLSVNAKTVGELLCAPSASLQLKITTKSAVREMTSSINVDLYDENGIKLTANDYLSKTVGKLFIINLYFKSYEDIDAVCSLIPWNEQNVDLNGTSNQ